jgi:hypothetical protein
MLMKIHISWDVMPCWLVNSELFTSWHTVTNQQTWNLKWYFHFLCLLHTNSADTHAASYVYWTMHLIDSWIKIDQLMSLALFFAQHFSNASTFIFRSLRRCVGILLWFDVCWRYGVVRLGWCGILMQTEAFDTCWAKNKASDISWSIFIQLSRWCMVQ